MGPLLQAAPAPDTFAAVTAGITPVQHPQVREQPKATFLLVLYMGDLNFSAPLTETGLSQEGMEKDEAPSKLPAIQRVTKLLIKLWISV